MRNKMSHQTVKNGLTFAAIVVGTSMLTACAGFFDKDNAPKPSELVAFTPSVKPIRLWTTQAGSGAKGDYLKLAPAMSGDTIYTSSNNGDITAVNKHNGSIRWQTRTGLTLTTGPGVGNGLVTVGSQHGQVIALDANSGNVRWKTKIKGELVANPAVKGNYVVVKAIDGLVITLSSKTGKTLWRIHQTEPDLVLRGASKPVINGNKVFIGFSNGNLLNAGLGKGDIRWVRQLATPKGAFAIERMIDVDADPVIRGNHIYAATYQGNITSLDWRSGRKEWSHKLSSFTGLTVDSDEVIVSDANSYLWGFATNSGKLDWRQKSLYARNISGPAQLGDYVVVGDAQGYVHWLNKKNGQFAARDYLGGKVYAKPLADNHAVYVYTDTGYLAAYTLKQ